MIDGFDELFDDEPFDLNDPEVASLFGVMTLDAMMFALEVQAPQ